MQVYLALHRPGLRHRSVAATKSLVSPSSARNIHKDCQSFVERQGTASQSSIIHTVEYAAIPKGISLSRSHVHTTVTVVRSCLPDQRETGVCFFLTRELTEECS